MLDEIKPPVRVNTRISHNANEWLDRKSEEMAISKSSLINMAIENYRKEAEVVENMPKIARMMEELEKMGIELPVK